MYNSDRPIENFEEDILGRKSFAQQLGKSILAFDSKDNFTIGLYGKWGSGKTSIINMTIKEIENQAKSVPSEKIPIIVRFEPWNFSDTNQLINQFFRHLRNSLNVKDESGIGKKVGEAFEEYAEAFEYAEAIPIIGKYAKILNLSSKFTGKQLLNKFTSPDILRAKEKLIKQLKDQKKKILVVIDDVDRLSNEQIRLIFQLVNSVAGLPNIIYLLSMDKDIVIRALESVQNCNGAEYLEKIIQVPFDVPELNHGKITDLLFDKLNNILKDKPDVQVDKNHWSKVFRACVDPFVESVRDVNRIVNAFQFKYDLVYQEVNFADMIGLTALQVMAPSITNWIYYNEDKICGGSNSSIGVVLADQEKKKNEYMKIFNDINIGSSELVLNALSSLFPAIEKEVSIMYENISEDKLRYEQRIAHPKKFKIYFSLDISNINIARELMNKSIYIMNENELDDLIERLNIDRNIIAYLQELRSYIEDIPIERIPMFAKVLYKHCNTLEGEDVKLFLTISAKTYCEWCIIPLMKRITSKDDRFSMYKEMLINADLDALQTMATEINRIELSYGRLAAKDMNRNESEQSITLEQLLELENLFVEQINILNEKGSILDSDSLLMLIYLWTCFDENGCKTYMKNNLKGSMNKLKYIVRQSSEWNSTNGRGWSFEEENYSDFLSTDEILVAIDELKSTDEFNEFDEIQQLKLASFVILNRGKTLFGHVSENEALKLVRQWDMERK